MEDFIKEEPAPLAEPGRSSTVCTDRITPTACRRTFPHTLLVGEQDMLD
ncbi:hypothetical protein ACWCPJ_37170 [Streptomyces collinus]